MKSPIKVFEMAIIVNYVEYGYDRVQLVLELLSKNALKCIIK